MSRPAVRSLSNIPETLQHNGMEVAAYRELPRPLRQLDELDRLWAGQAALHGSATHVLVLTAQRLKTRGLVPSVEYEAVLWEVAGRRLVWKAAPVVTGAQTKFTEGAVLAGEVLRALQRDGLLKLPKGHPTSLDDRELPQQWQPLLE